MKNLDILGKVKEIYQTGSNIMQFINELNYTENNSDEAVLISYDFQAGSYSESYFCNPEPYKIYAKQLSDEMKKIGKFETLLEVGVGEATNFKSVISELNIDETNCYGFDISWSRIMCAKKFLQKFDKIHPRLFTGNLFQAPVMDNAIDIVYTSHTLEPNGGREEEALKELYRMAKKYVFLFEPGYEWANEEAKARMRKHGYVRSLYETAKTLGYKIIGHKPLKFSLNPMNPTAMLIIEKRTDLKSEQILCCPIAHTQLEKHDNVMYSGQSCLMYPIIRDIPCLLPENAIICSTFE